MSYCLTCGKSHITREGKRALLQPASREGAPGAKPPPHTLQCPISPESKIWYPQAILLLFSAAGT